MMSMDGRMGGNELNPTLKGFHLANLEEEINNARESLYLLLETP